MSLCTFDAHETERLRALEGLPPASFRTTCFSNGRTLGERLPGVRVVSLARERPTLRQCLERIPSAGPTAGPEGGSGA